MLDRALRTALLGGLLALFAFPSATARLVDSWWGLFPFLFLFAAFAFSLLGWGGWIASRLQLGFAGAMLGASFAAVASAFLAGAVGALSARWLFFALLLPGAWLFPRYRPRAWPEGLNQRWVLAAFGFAAFVRFLSSFLPAAHGDPLLYHLAGPRLWQLAGGARVAPDLPNAILASSWEYFYVWPQIIWSRASASELVAAQVFCQWIHLLWGWLGAAVIVERLTRWNRADRWRFLAPLAALFPASLQWTAGVAKNDAGIAFWCLGAWWLCTEALFSGRRRLWALAGIFGGLAVSGKISAILFLAPAILVSWLEAFRVRRRVPWQEAAFFGIAFLAALLPIYARNWIETGNPLFPMFSNWFPSPWISQSWAEHFSSVHPKEAANRAQILLVRFRELSRESPLLWGLLLAPLALAFPRARGRLRPWAPWFAAGLLSAAIFVGAFSLDAEVRYLGATLILLAVGGLQIFRALAAQLPSPKAERFAAAMLFVAILASSKIPTHLLWKFPRMAPGEAFLLTHTAGDAKAWLREHTPAGALVVMMGDNESYYLLGMRVTVVTERPDLDRATKGVNQLPKFVEAICSLSGASYLLESRAPLGMEKRFPGYDFHAAIAFQGLSSRVYDLRALEEKLFPGRATNCGRVPAPLYGISSSSLK